jgi:cytochrome d ubiquinol oxidase subunit II
MILPYLVAFVLLLGITAYSTAGGVDFGAGIWDLLAGESAGGKKARALIYHAMAPVWETNNVWLVLSIVVTWTGFPLLFQTIFATLYPLYALALVALILRGAFFAFRHVADEPRAHRVANLVFGVSSLLAPFFFAASLGAIASGRLQAFSPMSIAFGLVSLAATAFSGAAFLVGDARRYGAADLVVYFQRRAVVAAGSLIVAGTAALGVIVWQAPELARSMLAGKGLPFTLTTMVLTPLAAFLIWRGIFRWYRVLVVAAVGSMVFAWAFAQSPYLVPRSLTVEQASAPLSTQVLLLIVTVLLVLVIVPAMGLLYYLDQHSALESPEA